MGFLSRLIGTPLGWIMYLIYKVLPNYALAIIIFALISKVLLFPFSVKMQKNQAAVTALQPKLDKLRKQYANNPEKLNEKTMELYAEEDVNPMASCTPMLIQLPILYGIMDVVYYPLTHILRIDKDMIAKATEILTSIEEFSTLSSQDLKYRGELFIIQAVKNPEYRDLFGSISAEFTTQVSEYNSLLFGIADLAQTPTLSPVGGWTAAAVIIAAIPILSVLVQIISTFFSNRRMKKMNPDSASSAAMNSTNVMMYALPLMFIPVYFNMPAAVSYYWTFSGIFGFIQSVILHKVYTADYVAKLLEKDKLKRKKKNKPNMMQRYQEMMAQQNGVVQAEGRTVSKSASADENNSEIKLSKSKQKDYERKIIAEARRRQAEKYGEEYDENDDGSID